MWRLCGRDHRAPLSRQLCVRLKGFIWPYVLDLDTADSYCKERIKPYFVQYRWALSPIIVILLREKLIPSTLWQNTGWHHNHRAWWMASRSTNGVHRCYVTNCPCHHLTNTALDLLLTIINQWHFSWVSKLTVWYRIFIEYVVYDDLQCFDCFTEKGFIMPIHMIWLYSKPIAKIALRTLGQKRRWLDGQLEMTGYPLDCYD